MKIFILRHGEAVDAPEVGGQDEPRYLTEMGKENIKAAAKGLRALVVRPELILTSPYIGSVGRILESG